MTKNILYLCTLIGLGIFAACKNDNNAQKAIAGDEKTTNGNAALHPDIASLSGHWIVLDLCSRADQYGSVLQAYTNSHIPFAFAFSFSNSSPDSVRAYDTREGRMIPFKIRVDTIELVNARNNKSVYLVYNARSEGSLTMLDGTSGRTQLDKMIKSKANASNGYTAFLAALNNNLFSGEFVPDAKGLIAPGQDGIQLTPGGFILHFKDFDRYEVCTYGDCLVMGNEMDVIDMWKSTNETARKRFGFKYNVGNDTLRLYNLLPGATPKEAYKAGKPAYTLVRKKVN